MTTRPSVGENAPVMDVVDVILRDGSTLRLRPPVRDDADAILDFFRALSEQSLYMRFHGFPSLGPQVVDQVLDSDWAERGALLGSLVETAPSGWSPSRTTRACATRASPRPPSPSPTRSSAAASARASSSSSPSAPPRHGIERFVAEVLPDNRRMLGVFEALGFELTRELAGGEVEITFPIARTERFEELLAERDHVP